jgi:hypothetical protein
MGEVFGLEISKCVGVWGVLESVGRKYLDEGGIVDGGVGQVFGPVKTK